jgi:hypothetical protein
MHILSLQHRNPKIYLIINNYFFQHHPTPLQAKLVREFITLSGCHIQIYNDPIPQSAAVPGVTTTYCRLGFG